MAIMTKRPRIEPNSSYYYFTTDEQLVYANFYQDFGPLNLAKLYQYCLFLNNALQDEAHTAKTFIYYTRKDPKKILNAAYLIGSYCIIYLQFNVPTVMKTLAPILKHANGAKFCDASINDLAFLSLKDCFGGIYKAVQKNFFDFNDFNVNDYEHYECVENGDFNWIVPDKLLAFCGPNSRTERTSDSVLLGPEVYIDYFHANNVTVVVRLNSPRYDAHAFTRSGIQHHDLYFSDGSSPSERLAKQFLKIVENSRGAVAVHCKAGLGRTGTLIGAYLIKHYQFTAMEAIAWLRICRPGSVIGQQQSWLNSKQIQLLQEGEIYRQQRHHLYAPPEKHDYGVYSMVKDVNMQNATSSASTQSIANSNQELDSENVQRISQRVDTMRLNDEDEQEESVRVDAVSHANNNIVHCKPVRAKKVVKLTARHTRWTRFSNGRTVVNNTASTTTTVRRGRGIVTVSPLGGTPQRAAMQETLVSRKKTVSTRSETITTPSALRNQRYATVQT
uniref:protein-tyrosine-phosphatase n=1 Tax=Anopheles maculatus TaxID=74869 RepID=A0A182T195_9DIPT